MSVKVILSSRALSRSILCTLALGFLQSLGEPAVAQSSSPASVEAGNVTISDQWVNVQLSSVFIDPVVVAGPASLADAAPGIVELANISSESFDIRFREWAYLDGVHAAEQVSYLVVERGLTSLPGGGQIVADTSAFGNRWSRTDFSATFSSTPIFLSTVLDNESSPVAPRIRRLNIRRVEHIQWWEEAGQASDNAHLNWIAWAKGDGVVEVDGFGWSSGTVSVDERPVSLDLDTSLEGSCFLADISTPTSNPVTLRRNVIDDRSLEIVLTEEQSRDSEVALGLENVSYLSLDCAEYVEELDEIAPQWGAGELAAPIIEEDTITLQWPVATDEQSGLSYYLVQQDGVLLVEQSTGSGNSLSVTGLQADTSYVFTVTAIDVAGNASSPLETSVQTATATAPDVTAPQWTIGQLEASAVLQDQLTLTWPEALDDRSVQIYRVSQNDDVIFEIPSGSGTTLGLSGLTAQTSYMYAVTALDTAGNESLPLSLTVSTAAALDETAPAWAEGELLATEVEANQLNLSWPIATDDNGIQFYRLSQNNELIIELEPASGTSLIVTQLIPSTDYQFTLTAVDTANNESSPLTLTLKTAAALDTSAPEWSDGSFEAPVVLFDQLTLTWPIAIDNSGIVEYVVSQDNSPVATASETTFAVTSLSANTLYTFTVTANDEVGNVSPPLTLLVTTPDEETGITPEWPDGAEISITDISENTIAISWPEALGDTGDLTYRVVIDNFVATETNESSWFFGGLTADTTYDISVVAFDSQDAVAAALTISATTQTSGTNPIFDDLRYGVWVEGRNAMPNAANGEITAAFPLFDFAHVRGNTLQASGGDAGNPEYIVNLIADAKATNTVLDLQLGSSQSYGWNFDTGRGNFSLTRWINAVSAFAADPAANAAIAEALADGTIRYIFLIDEPHHSRWSPTWDGVNSSSGDINHVSNADLDSMAAHVKSLWGSNVKTIVRSSPVRLIQNGRGGLYEFNHLTHAYITPSPRKWLPGGTEAGKGFEWWLRQKNNHTNNLTNCSAYAATNLKMAVMLQWGFESKGNPYNGARNWTEEWWQGNVQYPYLGKRSFAKAAPLEMDFMAKHFLVERDPATCEINPNGEILVDTIVSFRWDRLPTDRATLPMSTYPHYVQFHEQFLADVRNGNKVPNIGIPIGIGAQ